MQPLGAPVYPTQSVVWVPIEFTRREDSVVGTTAWDGDGAGRERFDAAIRSNHAFCGGDPDEVDTDAVLRGILSEYLERRVLHDQAPETRDLPLALSARLDSGVILVAMEKSDCQSAQEIRFLRPANELPA